MESESVNPFLIDLVLENIFQRLPSSHLKRCRLVCQQWSQIGFIILKFKSKEDILFGDSNNLQAFSTMLKTGSNLPFKSFTLQPSVFSNLRSQTIQDFFITTANCLKSLILMYQDHSHYFTLEKTNFLDRNLRFPNLHHIRFEILPFDQLICDQLASSTLNGVDLFCYIFNAAINLVRLELVVPKCQTINADQYLRVIGESHAKVHTRFTELVLNISFCDASIDILKNARFQFKMLRISQNDSEFNRSSPLDFIRNHVQSLQHLKIDLVNIQDFPSLPFLHTLEILDRKFPTVTQSHSDIQHFSMRFAMLRKLVFTAYNWNTSYLSLFPIRAVKTVRELKLPKQIELNDNSILVPRIFTAFPLLVKLEIFLSQETIQCLQEIFIKLSQLEELSVTFINWRGSKCIDFILTGIPEWGCQEIYSFRDVTTVDVSGVRINPSILDLPHLKRLQLRNMTKYGINGRPQITDISIYYGIILHPRLTTLCIWSSEMSREGIHQLRQKLKLTLHSF